ncbi:MAG TPA: hypothetical protein VGZ29_03275 [Terriglobia bacterium]|nr:hypothetical protein [Terriglobia bacterium]
MKELRQGEKRKAALLGLLCLALVIYLVWTYVSTGAASATGPGSSAAPARTATGRDSRGLPEDLAVYDPKVDLRTLDRLQGRPAPAYTRSPFDFGVTPEEKKAMDAKAAAAPLPLPISPPLLAAAPPLPAPITLKALGYEEEKGAPRQAFIEDCPGTADCSENTRDVHVYTAKKGDLFGNRYKVLQITATAVEVEDEAYHRTEQLQFPQEGGRQRQ